MSVDLGNARLYLVAGATIGGRRLESLVPELVDAGVDLIQLREKEMEAGDVLRAAGPVLEACRRAGVPFVLNDRPDIALMLGADGVHVGQNDLPVEATRRFMGDRIVGWSTHREAEVEAALRAPIDYFAVGPVYETPTKPGRPAAGLDLVRHAASLEPRVPWFAIGGVDEETIDEVLEAGARRAVVVRAITEAADPPGAAARLKEKLLAAGI